MKHPFQRSSSSLQVYNKQCGNRYYTQAELRGENERKMANNILEQFEELYSRWSMAEKVGRKLQLEDIWQQLSGSYNYLFQIYQHRGYLTPDEATYANQLSQMLAGLQVHKKRVDQELSEEMIKHLAKMIVKR